MSLWDFYATPVRVARKSIREMMGLPPEMPVRVLRDLSKNAIYSTLGEEAAIAAGRYLERMKETNPDKLASSRGVKVHLTEPRRFSLDGGYELDIKLI